MSNELVSLGILGQTLFHHTRGCLTFGERKALKDIETALKALEIIKEKRVNVDNFLDRITNDTDYKEYKRLVGLYKITVFSNKDLTEEEFDLLKEELL